MHGSRVRTDRCRVKKTVRQGTHGCKCCSMHAHRDVDGEVWSAVRMHIESVVQGQGDVTEIKCCKQQTQTVMTSGALLDGRIRNELGCVSISETYSSVFRERERERCWYLETFDIVQTERYSSDRESGGH